ncbi:hypothetical protein [Acinetobacter populi]|jgi:hypothetical protein|uniref:Uncharacterized protein n=1 Tax=Acinetobacter populi TaxID=1582270 RepID=A0A1Z9Z1R7_9GAMM|nr:hypothetical protein [Acinetobacter populi]MCH4246350.1 hypothetical protein [Acinetobacter populi]OUY08395.1 hypothetical protein CAP51_01885 [Acinetobacter populi]
MKKQLLLICLFSSFAALTHANPPAGGGFDRSAMNKLCNGKKIGDSISTKMGDRTVKGTCQLGFAATGNAQLPRGERGQNSPLEQACKGKKLNQATSVKVNGQTINGKCEVRFKAQR